MITNVNGFIVTTIFKTQDFTLSKPIVYGYGSTVFARALVALYENKVCYLGFDSKKDPFLEFKKYCNNKEFCRDDIYAQTILDKIFIKKEKPNLILFGKEFEIDVWKALLSIDISQTLSYQEIAYKIGRPKAHRAVATAIGRNPISYIIPCHRVVLKSGKLGKYGWGAMLKKKILEKEGVKISL